MMRQKIPWLMLGVAFGILFTFSPGSGFVLMLVLVGGLFFWICTGVFDRRFVLSLFLIGFLVRAVLSLGLDGLAWRVERGKPFREDSASVSSVNILDNTRSYVQMGDSDYYSQKGYLFAQHARGVPGVLPPSHGDYGWHGYLHVIGVFYYLFGYSPVAVKLFNCFLGALLGPVLFFLAQICFNSGIARWSGCAATFFPSLIFWSTTNLKEPSILLLSALLFLLFCKIQSARRRLPLIFYSALFLTVFMVHTTMRSASYSFTLVGCSAASAFVTSRFPKKWKLTALLLLIGALLVRQHEVRSFLAQLFMKHIGYVTTVGNFYKYLPEQFYSSEQLSEWVHSGSLLHLPLLWGMVQALFHYFLEPLPWRINTLFLSATFPQVVAWYFLIPFVFFGFWIAVRWNWRRCLFLVSTLVVWIVLSALANGNVGTVFRIRDMATPFLLIFACVGLRRFLYSTNEFQPHPNPLCDSHDIS